MNDKSNETLIGGSSYPDDNPKTMYGIKKVPLHLVPPSASHALAMGFADGAVKYGPYNWREKTVSTSVYIAAAKRHIDAFWDGEDVAEDSGVPHLGHAMACLAIIYDGLTVGKLNDDRPPKGASPRLQKEYASKESNGEQQDAEQPGPDEPVPARRWRDRVDQAIERGADVVEPADTVEHGGLSDLQADLQSGYVRASDLIWGDHESAYYYTTDGGVERYDHAGHRLDGRSAAGGIHTG